MSTGTNIFSATWRNFFIWTVVFSAIAVPQRPVGDETVSQTTSRDTLGEQIGTGGGQTERAGSAPQGDGQSDADWETMVEPLPGSPLRMALMDALRPTYEQLTGVPVKLVPTTLRVRDSTALFIGRPVHLDGRDFTEAEIRRIFDEQVYDGVDGMAWLTLRDGQWMVKGFLVNQSDVGFLGWCTDSSMRQLLQTWCPVP